MPSELFTLTSKRGQPVPEDILDKLSRGAFRQVTRFYRPDQSRDESGKFEDEGKGSEGPGYQHPGDEGEGRKASSEPSELDRRITDYKPDRSLSDPSKTVELDQYLPGVSYSPYSKTPFFGRINALQGTLNPDKMDIGQFVRDRDEVFNTLPVTEANLDNVVVTQEVVNKERVQQIIDKPETGGTKPIQAVKYGGKTYILNGHHRVAADIHSGKHSIKARVLDLDHPEPTPPVDEADARRYVRDLAATQEYQTVENRLKTYGATPLEREMWSAEANSKGGKLTPEREALHNEIIKGMLNSKAIAPEGKRPNAIFLMGKPAAGKSTGAAKFLKRFGEVTTLSQDNIAEKLPEYRGWNRPIVHGETKTVLAELTAQAVKARESIVVDEVGSNATKLKARADLLTKNGYDVHIVHVAAPMSQTAPLMWKRFHETGRFTDPSYVLDDVDSRPDDTYQQLKKDSNIKSWVEIDNKDFAGKVIDEGKR